MKSYRKTRGSFLVNSDQMRWVHPHLRDHDWDICLSDNAVTYHIAKLKTLGTPPLRRKCKLGLHSAVRGRRVETKWFCMVFTLARVQESIENNWKISPANHTPKTSENLRTWLKKNTHTHTHTQIGGFILGPFGIQKSLFSDLGAFRLHFCPQVVFWATFGGQMTSKCSLNDP